MLKNVDNCSICGHSVVRLSNGKWYHYEDCEVGPPIKKHQNVKYSGKTKFPHEAIPKRESKR
jgi:hypothetical protein